MTSKIINESKKRVSLIMILSVSPSLSAVDRLSRDVLKSHSRPPRRMYMRREKTNIAPRERSMEIKR